MTLKEIAKAPGCTGAHAAVVATVEIRGHVTSGEDSVHVPLRWRRESVKI
ncbi:MAG: hypothetical protein V3W06_07510 [Acidimicrobiia bacterium]